MSELKALDEFFDKEADQDFAMKLGHRAYLDDRTPHAFGISGYKEFIPKYEELLPSASSGKKISRRELVKKTVEMAKRKFKLKDAVKTAAGTISRNYKDLTSEITTIAKFIRDEMVELNADDREKLRAKGAIPPTTVSDTPILDRLTLGLSAPVRFAPVFEKTELIEKLREKNYKTYDKLTSILPKAPFVTDTDSWTQLGIKKLITKAVDEGYDYVSFSPGHVQYKRWDEDGLIEYYDKIIPKNARKVVDKIDKEAIVKLDGNRFKTEDGEGLDADESVLNPFYDSEELDFPEPEYGAILPRFSIKITPKLKEKILKEGLPLYKKGGEVSKDTATIIELMKR